LQSLQNFLIKSLVSAYLAMSHLQLI